MSLWGFDGEDNSLTTWSSLTQFDDMVWNEFGETNGDHVVPNPSSPNSSWLPNGDRPKRIPRETSLSGSTIKVEFATSTGLADSASELSSEVEDRSTDTLLPGNATNLPADTSEGAWAGIERGAFDRTAESEPFGSDHPPVSQETDDTGDEVVKNYPTVRSLKGDRQLYSCEEDASMESDPFSVSDVASQDGGLEIFENENAASKADTLLELGWENITNLDDMDKLFRNNDTSFEPVLLNGAEVLDWPSSSSPPVGTLDSDMQFEKSPVSASIAAKVEVEELEDKAEVGLEDCLPGLVMDRLNDVVADNDDPTALNTSVDTPVQLDSRLCEDTKDISLELKSAHETVPPKGRPTERTGVSMAPLCEAEKVSVAQAQRARRHPLNRKRGEERFKKITAYRRLSPGPPYSAQIVDGRQLQPRPLRISGQPPLLQPATTYPLQYFPPNSTPGVISAPHQLQMSQGVPYIQVAYPVHHLPAMSSPTVPMMQMQHPQSMFVDIQQAVPQGPVLLPQASPLAPSWAFDVSNRPPTSSLNMTPQEKMEKLRWRQQMQARMAVEQQQRQLLASHSGDGIDQTYQKQQVGVRHDTVPNQPRRPSKSASDLAMSPLGNPSDASQRFIVKEGNLPSTNDNGDYSLEGSVLCQLKSTASALDLGTRLCIRDALYRLARSAMKRRSAGTDNLNDSQESKEEDSDANAVESSTASGPPSSRQSRGTSMSVVETETNPIDRSIAKLLFSKPQPTMFARPYGYT
ncbi:unnamed protein product [Calypogeia fissa]